MMKKINVCIGSACHLKGSYDVLEAMQQLVIEYNLQDILEVKAAFCLQNCTEGVSVKRWDDKVLSVSRENVKQIFVNEIIAYL